jgi:hypothetical protein
VVCFAQEAPPKVPEADARAIVSGIEDEIYDYHLQENYHEIGELLSGERTKVPVYVLPGPKSTGHAYFLIYRLMPYGEMYRLVSVREDGSLAWLNRNPAIGFPPHGAAMQTVYLDDDEICSAKHRAAKFFFVVEMNPTKERIKEAVERQKTRYGFSQLEREGPKKPKR